MLTALQSLFTTNHIEITANFGFMMLDEIGTSCGIVAVIRQLQTAHPELEVDFHGELTLTLKLGNVSSVHFLTRQLRSCPPADCAECRIFYPNVIYSIAMRAHDRVLGALHDEHLANRRLDRCKIGSIVSDLNRGGEVLWGSPRRWFPLKAELNAARDLATITFETAGADRHQFEITVGCGHCLNNSCFGCGDNV